MELRTEGLAMAFTSIEEKCPSPIHILICCSRIAADEVRLSTECPEA
jgi:hypothetical protein